MLMEDSFTTTVETTEIKRFHFQTFADDQLLLLSGKSVNVIKKLYGLKWNEDAKIQQESTSCYITLIKHKSYFSAGKNIREPVMK